MDHVDLDLDDFFPLLLGIGILSRSVFDPESKRSGNQFDLVARVYPALEQCVFGSRLSRARLAFFDAIVQRERILLLGEGNGRFLTLLLAHKNRGCIKVVEKSAVMIRLAKARVRKVGEAVCALKFIESDVRDYEAARKFDCVVTHFLLDSFHPPGQQSVIRKITELTTPSGTWINVDFLPARTLRGGILMWTQYAFFRLVSKLEARRCYDPSAAAAAAGWTVVETISYLGGLVVAKRWQKVPFPGS